MSRDTILKRIASDSHKLTDERTRLLRAAVERRLEQRRGRKEAA